MMRRGKADTEAGLLLGAGKPPEGDEELRRILHREAGAVVPDEADGSAVDFLLAEFDEALLPDVGVLPGIIPSV